MKLNLKNGVAGMLVAVSILPVFAFAEDTTTSNATTATSTIASVKKPINNFCTNLTATGQKLLNSIDTTEAKTLKKWSDNASKLANKQSDIDAKRATDRSNIDAKRVNNWEKMITKAKTPEQQAAVTTYKTSIQAAVDTRRAAVDAAVSAYRAGLTTTMTTQSGAVDQAIATFKTAVNTAISKAQSDCAANISNGTIRSTYNKSVNDARKALQLVKKNGELTSGLKALKQTRDSAIKVAETTFKTSTEQARAVLTTTLKK